LEQVKKTVVEKMLKFHRTEKLKLSF